MNKFKVVSEFSPKGDQIKAIDELVKSIKEGNKFQTLLGVTGSGKTFTMAKVIEKLNRPTLVLAHNKTLAAQLASEFKSFFPNNAVEFFVSYYDYYQPEAYVKGKDLYIEKDATINDEIDKLRHSATSQLHERKDVIVVASVSCIYGLGSPIDYKNLVLSLREGTKISRKEIIQKLVNMQYKRTDIDFKRASFRVRGDIIEIITANNDKLAYRIELFGDEVENLREINVITGDVINRREHIALFPASHYVTSEENIKRAVIDIEKELDERVKYFDKNNKFLESQRIKERTNYDVEMLKEMGFCSGIENYSRILLDKKEGERPFTLIDYFGDDFLFFIDESHVSLPQVRGMYKGDRSRKESLVEHGFRLPSALDNRPLKFDEFFSLINQAVFVSATPGDLEKRESKNIVEQIIRPTGLVDPKIEVREIKSQVDDLYKEIKKRIEKDERVLITTLTKRMAEDLTTYFKTLDLKVTYMHSDIDTLERMQIIRSLRLGENDVLIGINLLREGLDIPEVSLVAILDADKEGFLRSEQSLIQTIGRAARNKDAMVIMYADTITKSMENAIDETNRRRKIQTEYNIKNNIEPKTIKKEIKEVIYATKKVETKGSFKEKLSKHKREEKIKELQIQMKKAADELNYELAIDIRDAIENLKGKR